jgi:hypothetical protein
LVALYRETAGSTVSVTGKQKRRRYGLYRTIFTHPPQYILSYWLATNITEPALSHIMQLILPGNMFLDYPEDGDGKFEMQPANCQSTWCHVLEDSDLHQQCLKTSDHT